MNNQSDIIIIGAGLIGLCTADALAARGASIRVLDMRPGPCEGTSFSNSGMIHPSQAMSWEPNECLTRDLLQARVDAAFVTAELAKTSQALLSKKILALGLSPRVAGSLQLHPDLDAALAAQAEYKKLGIKADIQMHPDDTFGMAACYFPNDTSGNSRVFGCALAQSLEAQGVAFTYDALNLNIRQSDGQFFVSSSQGIFQSEHLVVAAGPHSPDCLARLGVRLQISAVAGAAADFTLPDDKTGLPLYPVMDVKSRSALTVFENHVRISGGWHLTDPSNLIIRWREIAPNLIDRFGAPISTWSGNRPVSPVGRPYISGTSIPNLWVNTGHGHMGWTLCAGSGELLAKLLMDGVQDQRFAFAG